MGYATLVFRCAACGATAHANPRLVIFMPARWDGVQFVADADAPRQPICRAGAEQLLARFVGEGRPVPAVVGQPDDFARAYDRAAGEQES